MSKSLARFSPGDEPVVVQARSVAVFTDLHLSTDNPYEIQEFSRSLVNLKGRADNLIILGDLFDVYVGREDFVHPYFDHFRAVVKYLAEHGCPTYIVRGNRDVMINAADAKHIGFHVADTIWLDLPDERRVILTHGDAFCLADLPYQRLRRILRLPGMRGFLRTLPHWLRVRIGKRMRGYSKQEVARKPLDSMALTLPQVESSMQAAGAEHVVIGHLHAEQRHILGSQGQLTVLPAWEPGTGPWMVPEMLDETV